LDERAIKFAFILWDLFTGCDTRLAHKVTIDCNWMEEGFAPNYLCALPEEIALDVLIYLDLPQLYQVSQVCKQFYRYTKDSSLHQVILQHYAREFKLN
jgi:hypothetical protein